jgi:rhodanese-related sulfurtransferase
MFKRNYLLLLLIPVMFYLTGCSKDDNPVDPGPSASESEILIKYLEDNGDFANTKAPTMIAAQAVRDNMLAGADQVIIDIRSAEHFTGNGHIEGAVNVQLADVVNYYETNSLQNRATVVIACYSGQSAAYVVSILRILGYNNVFDLKFGMSAWNRNCANSWMPKIGNGRAADFVTTPYEKNAAGSLPTINTGKSTGPEILRARVQELLTAGYSAASVDNGTVYSNMSNYYIVNYWKQEHYNIGHIAGAVQYTPGTTAAPGDFRMDKYLKTLPTDKPVVVYCYTGQTSSFMAAYLRLIGYDAKSLSFGANAMIYDIMVANGMTVFTEDEIKDFDIVN